MSSRVKRNLNDPENRAFWKSVNEGAAEVDKWPAWKRGFIEGETMSDQAKGAITDEEIYMLASEHEYEHGTDMFGFARALLALAGERVIAETMTECPCYCATFSCAPPTRTNCRCHRQYRHDKNLGDILLPLSASPKCVWAAHGAIRRILGVKHE